MLATEPSQIFKNVSLPPLLFLIMIRIFLPTIFLVFGFSSLCAQENPIDPIELQCESQSNPLGIDVAAPQFSYRFKMVGKNQEQDGYEIIVSDKPENLVTLTNLVWSSGKIQSNQNTAIDYAGRALQPFTKYYWKVRAYNKTATAPAWSEVATFETAMLTSSDWKAEWIGDGSAQFLKDEDFYQDDRVPLFKKRIGIKKKVSGARLYIAGLGYYEAYLNGKKIGDRILEPGWTTYQKQVLYSVYDITALLNQGENVAGVMLGNGWYNPLPLQLFGKYNLRKVQETGRPCVKAEYHIQYMDGTTDKIITDETWLTAPGPITRNNVYLGEHYDARLEQVDWHTQKINPSIWKNASLSKGPSGKLTAQMQPPIRVTKVIKPISIKEISTGIFIADMGENFAGVARIKVKGKKGTTIRLKYGEALHPDGTLNYLTTVAGQIKDIWKLKGGPGAPLTAWQEDGYTLKGNGEEVWSPRFTFHGFRFVEIIGWPGQPSLNSIEGLRMNADLSLAGDFQCSNQLFNQLHETINRTFLSNVFSVQSDCPGREKMGYGADMVVTANAFMYNFDMSHFYRKAVQDFANEQQPDGGITETAPYTGIASRGYGGASGPLGWQLAFPYLQQQLYLFYGDRKIISSCYPQVVKQMDFLQSHAIQGLYHWDIGDHIALDPRAEAFSASTFYYHHALLAAEFAQLLGKNEDYIKFTDLAKTIKENIVRKYWVPNTGRFDNATQAAQLFALWYDLSPEKEKTMEVLMSEFSRHRDHVSSGIFGVKMMFDVLRDWNKNELAYKVANQKDFPGWGYMLSKGATTLWEDWNYPDNAPSQNHPMFGSIDEWFYRSLLGINATAPGFEKFEIKPQPAGDLTWAKGSYRSIKGKIESGWRIEGNQFTLAVSVPPNTKASIWMPSVLNGTVVEMIKGKANSPVKVNQYRDGYAYFEIGSGEYSFRSSVK